MLILSKTKDCIGVHGLESVEEKLTGKVNKFRKDIDINQDYTEHNT